MLYTSHIHPSAPRCGSLQNTEDATHWILASTEGDLVSSKHLKLLLAAGQRRLLTEQLRCNIVVLKNNFSGDCQGQMSQFMNRQLAGSKK